MESAATIGGRNVKNNLCRKLRCFCLLLSLSAFAVPAAPQTDQSVEEFWTKFKAAVHKSDKASVALMSQFPIAMPYGYPKIRNRSQLIRRWREIFNTQANAAKCFEDAKPVLDSTDAKLFTVGCKDADGNEVVVYGFRKGRAGWKLVFLDNINE